MSSNRSREHGSGVPHPTPGSRWRDLDALDRSWSGVSYVRALTGIDVPPAPRLRRALAQLAIECPELGRWTSDVPPRWRPVEVGELDEWLDRSFAASDDAGLVMQAALERNLDPLTTTPLRLLVGPDWISVRMTHALGDGWTVNTVLGHLLQRAAAPEQAPPPVPWTVFSRRRRDAIIARETLRRLPTLYYALRHRRELAGGEYEPASAHADTLRDHSFAVSDAEYPQKVREIRDEWFPGASAAAVTMVGLRAALEGSSLPAARPGFECLFNTRQDSMGTQAAWGNWSVGIYIRPSSDLSPAAVHAEMQRVRNSGLPELAHASLRARARRSDPTSVAMPKAVGAPRLTMSYTTGHLVRAAFTGLRDGESDLGTWSRPNGVESITVQAVECAGRLSVGLSFFPEIWPEDVVCGAVREFLRDPESVFASVFASVSARTAR